MGKKISYFLFTLTGICLLTAFIAILNNGLRSYETTIEPFLTLAQENTLGIFSSIGIVLFLLSGLVLLLITDD